MCEHMSIYFTEHPMSKRISHYLFCKIIANWALKKRTKRIPKRQTSKLWRWTCTVILRSDRRYKSSEETITNARDSNLLIWGCSLGSWHNPESPEGSGCIPAACDHLHMDTRSPQSTAHGSFFSRQPRRWQNPHLTIGEQPCRIRPWWCLWPGSPAPDGAAENPAGTL